MTPAFILCLLVTSQAPRGAVKTDPKTGITSIVIRGSASSPDAGVTLEPLRAPTPVTATDLDKLRKELNELRGRVSDLEGRLAKAEAAASEVGKLKEQLSALREQFDAAEEKRLSEEREVARRKAQTAQANATVQTVLQQLTLGTTSNVDAWLRTVEGQYQGDAAKLVSLARASFAQSDLIATRQFLVLALLEAARPPAP